MADFTGLAAAVAALTQNVDVKEKAYSRLLLNEALDGNFTTVPNMQKGMLTPTFEVGTNVKPFSTTLSSTDSQVIGGKPFTLFPNKIEESVNPQKYYDWWEALGLKGSFDPNSFPLEQYIVERLIDRNAEQIRNVELWSGVRNNSGTTSAAIIDGFSKIITDAVTAVAIPATNVYTGAAPSAANIIDTIEAIILKVGAAYRKQTDMQVLVSEELFGWYWDKYKANSYGARPETAENGNAIVMEKWGNILLKREISMTTAGSKRIIATPKSNLQVGTNMANFKDYVFKTFDKGWTFDILMYFEMACGIYEFNYGAIAVNNQS